jgi:hypothetical protein
MITYFYTLDYDDVPTEKSQRHINEETADRATIAVSASEKSLLRGTTDEVATIHEYAGSDLNRDPNGDILPSNSLSNTNSSDRPNGNGDQNQRRKNVASSLRLNARVYAIADKYGTGGLKSLAQHKFEVRLHEIDLETDVFAVINEVYSSTPDSDRGLRDFIVAKMYSEIQFWVMQEAFLDCFHHSSDFCKDLFQYTVRKDFENYEAAIANISHPGYCGSCQATLVLKRTVSRRKNVHVDKYCAKCDPWH